MRLVYRLHILTAPITISWPGLNQQFGQSYSELRFFRRDVLPPLQLALAVYPEARVHIDERAGLTLYPSAPAGCRTPPAARLTLDFTHARQS